MPAAQTVIIPLGNRIIVRLAPGGSQAVATDGAEPLSDVRVRGMVIAAGAGDVDERGRSVPLAIAAGDLILFDKHRGREITFGEMPCWIIDADDVVKIDASAARPLLRSKLRSSRP